MESHIASALPPDGIARQPNGVPLAPKGMQTKVRIAHLHEMKRIGRKISMATAYDAAFARIADEAGIDMVLVGDSVGMVVHGMDSTIPVTMDMMVLHSQAVVRGAKRSFIVTDLPFMSYHVSNEDAVRNAGRLVKEGGAEAVKLELCSEAMLDRALAIHQAGIPVVGHLGLLPQSIHALSGYRVQGRGDHDADRILRMAKDAESAGAFMLVLECIPLTLAEDITSNLRIPTIGIGAGNVCDGQVLVMHDMLGFTETPPRFVRKYADLRAGAVRAFRKYARDVREKTFPADKETYE